MAAAGGRPSAIRLLAIPPILAILLVAGAAPAAGQSAPEAALAGEVHGRITADADGPGGIPLSYALVELTVPGGARTALTDVEGRYRFADVPAGPARLRAHYLGHAARTLEVLVPAGGRVAVDLELAPRAVVIPGLTVTADPFTVRDPDGPGPLTASTAGVDVELALLELTPGLAEVALGPGGGGNGGDGQNPADPRHVLLMRGSTADLKLVLLDGAPVYTPFHLGGLLESFDAGVLGRAAHHVGGAPARYDGGLSYILDLETRRPGSGPGVRGSVDMISASAAGEMAIGRGGLLASGRALHNGAPRLLDGVPSPYGYRDGLVRGAFPVRGAELGFTLFGNREEVRLGNDRTPLAPEAARWGNALASARLSHSLGITDLRWTAAVSRYDAELPLRAESEELSNPVLARGETGRIRMALEGERPFPDGTVRFGATFDDMSVHFASRLLTREGVVRTDARSEGRVLGAYGELQRTLGDQLLARVGGRVDRFDPGGVRTGLRGALSWSITPAAVLSLSAGRYHQLARAADGEVETALVPGARQEEGEERHDLGTYLAVATGDHVVLGLDQTLAPSVELGLRGFVKRFEGVGGPGRQLSASGVDLRLQTMAAGRTGWLGYALSWSWESALPGATEQFTGRHLLTAGFRGPVSGPLGVDLRVAYSDGLPFTEVQLGVSDESSAALDAQPLLDEDPALAGDAADGFLRIDLELYAEWDAAWAGREGRIRPYVRLLNALDRRDALFYYFEPWRDEELTPLARRPIMPVVGLAWSF